MNFPYELVDLTHNLDSAIPTWDGDCGFYHDLYLDYSDCQGEDKFCVMKLRMHAAIGTHMDAPSHCILGGKSIDNFGVNELVMPCFVIDISQKCHERYSLTVQDIVDFEAQFGSLLEGSCVFIKTGWEQFWNEPLRYHNKHVFPSVDPLAAEVLLARGVNALGIDTLSPDRPEDGFKVHKKFLASGKLLVENLVNLSQMPQAGSFVMILPLKIKNGTEAPARVVGLIPKIRL